MRQVDWAWAAGFVDGEGCLHWTGNTPTLRIVQVEKAPLLVLVQLFGVGAIYPHKPQNPQHKLSWELYIGGRKNLLPVLLKLSRYLLVKGAAADEILCHFSDYMVKHDISPYPFVL